MASEQTYLCTLQVGTPLILRSKCAEPCIPQWSNGRLTLINGQGIHEATIPYNNVFWIRLLRCSVFKVRVLVDKKSGSWSPNLIRVYIVTQNLVSQLRSLNTLVEEELFQECLQAQPYCIETIDTHLDRSLRKLMRVANERLKETSEIVSEHTSDIAALFMRLRESNDGFPNVNVPIAQTSIGDGSGIRQNWSNQSFETLSNSEKPSTKQTFYANELSQTERSVLCAWRMACADVMSSGPTKTWFFAPHCLMIYVNQVSDADSWVKMARELGMSSAVACTGRIPADILKCDILIVPLAIQTMVLATRDSTVSTLSFAMRLQNELVNHTSTIVNEQRMRRLQMSTLNRWTTDTNVLFDLPLAWFFPGSVLYDCREGPIHRQFDGLIEPSIEILTGSSDFSQRNMWDECKQLTASMCLGPSKKYFKNLRVRQVIVPPDLIETKMHQVASAFEDPAAALAKMQAAQNSLHIRGNLQAWASEKQLESILDDHHREWPNQSVGQWIQKVSGALRRRPSIDNAESTCDICVEPIDRKMGVWTTVCGHSYCSVCAPLAFRNWTSNHNAATTFIDCPSCRTSLSSFDTVRIKDGIPDQMPLDNLTQAVDREINSLPKRTRSPNHMVLSCYDDPSETFYRDTQAGIQNLILTHISETTLQEWQVQIILWASQSKKNLRVSIIGPPGHAPTLALKKLLDP